MAKHTMIKGIRDGKAHCTCGWASEFGGNYGAHIQAVQGDYVVNELKELADGLSWLGAQGNTPAGNNVWDGVVACIDIIKDRIQVLQQSGASPNTEPVSMESHRNFRTRVLRTAVIKETYECQCQCGKTVYLDYNGGEMDSHKCTCGRYYMLESPIVEIWFEEKR